MPTTARAPSSTSLSASTNTLHTSSHSPARPGVPSASSSTTSLPGASNTNSLVSATGALTLEMILEQNASSNDPKLSALEQALNERNTLSSQNAQLWKLIEKQRSGYNHILKELERVRGERDSYKAKFGAVFNSSHGHRTQSHPTKPESMAAPSETFPTNGDHTPAKSRAPAMNRHHSDEKATPRTSAHTLHQTQSQEPLNGSPRTLSIDQTSNVRTKSSLAPLVVPPRSESLPTPPPATLEAEAATPFPPHHAHSDSVASSSTGHTRPTDYSRKSSITDSLRSFGTSTSSHTNTPPPQHNGFNSSQHHPGPPPQPAPIQTTQYTNPSASNAMPNPYSPSNQISLLSASGPTHQLSRDSRISLPDEARQYIANMVDSPTTSPKVGMFTATKSPLASASVTAPSNYDEGPVAQKNGNQFLDLDEDEGDEDDDEDEDDDGVDDSRESLSYDGVDRGSVSQLSKSPSPSQASQAPTEDFPLPPSEVQSYPQAQPRASTSHYRVGGYDNPESNHSHTLPSGQPSRQAPDMKETANVPASFRALPLLTTDLPRTTITVFHSFVRPNDRGKEVLSFIVYVNPGNGKDGWKVEKMYSDVLTLDQRVRSSVGKGLGKRMANLPEGKLWKDHAPAKVDQRKAVLQTYLQALINLPVKNNHEVIAFFTSDIVRETNQPVLQAGHKEGYLTKRGKNFGGWKTRYFMLSGPVLEYYDCRGGTHLGSITITGAQIGRQQRSERSTTTDEEKEYRHAFLIVEAKKGPGGNHPRHVLCAESDADRDGWVEMLVRYFSGTYSEEPISLPPSSTNSSSVSVPQTNGTASQAPPSSNNSYEPSAPVPVRRPVRGVSKDDISVSKPVSRPPPDAANAKLFGYSDEYNRSSSPSKSLQEPSPTDHIPPNPFADNQNAKRVLERGLGQPSSLPDSSPLSNFPGAERANSELGHYSDQQEPRTPRASQHHPSRQHSPERHRVADRERKSLHPSLGASPAPSTQSQTERVPSPEKLDPNSKVKISGPINGAPIPAGYKFGSGQPDSGAISTNDRREKAKSRSFWGFGRPNDKVPTPPPMGHVPRAVFGVPLEEALDVACIAHLPAIVFRSIQYLEAKKADQEEGIYRLSGSSAVVKSLKDKFNTEGDVDLVASDEYWDPHAVAGLLKSFLRELPASILTRELHLRFLSVIDFANLEDRIKELTHLIASLPLANYSLLRAMTAHLILVVQNSGVNKMNMRNVGIVFSPTLGIPAGVFSLMLGEFNTVFNVDGIGEDGNPNDDNRRNSRQYSDGAADQLLGLSGRTLTAPPPDEGQSDGDEYSVQEDSGTENEESKTDDHSEGQSPPDTPMQSNMKTSKASSAAASRGLNVTVTHSDRGNRHSRMIGLPTSPRPPPSPSPGSSSPH